MKHIYQRRIAAVTAAVLSVCVLLPSAVVLAEETEESSSTFDDGTLTYTILNSKEVSVTGCGTSATNISIMPEIDGYDVVAIGDEAFANCTSLQSLTIPETITEIGTGAFYGCSSLTSLKLPNAVTEIQSGTFFNCTGLTELTLGDSVTGIGDMAFGYCSSLPELELPDTVETMGNQVFYYCAALEFVSIPEKVTELGGYTFYGCLALTKFEVPKALEDVGAMSFVACPSLETITVAEGNTKYMAEDGILYDAEQSILYVYPAGKTETTFVVPESVLVIYAGSFFAASQLQQVTLNEKLQYIGEMAFDFCSGLTEVTIPKNVTNIGETAFADCTAVTSVTFEGASAEDGGEGESLEIGDYAFFCCDSLKEVLLPKRVSSIGQYAFGCTSPADGETGDDIVTIESESGSSLQVKALDGFLLSGYTGAASDYVKNSEVDLNFQSVNFNWKGLVFWVVLAAVLVAVVLIAIRLVRRSMMTAAEKAALRDAQKAGEADATQEGNAPTEPEKLEFDDGYRSIIDDEDEAAEEIAAYDDTISHTQLHQMGHASAQSEDETK